MTIGDLASKSGIPASTIRYWERIGILPAAARISGQRRYSKEDIHRTAVLQLARACGFRLDEMLHRMHGFSPKAPASQRWQLLASKKKTELNLQIAQLKAMRRIVDRVSDCKCAEAQGASDFQEWQGHRSTLEAAPLALALTNAILWDLNCITTQPPNPKHPSSLYADCIQLR